MKFPLTQKGLKKSQNELSRRQLIKTGLFGSVILTVSSGAAVFSPSLLADEKLRSADSARQSYQFLEDKDVTLITALLPAIIGSNWPENTEHQTLATSAALISADQFIFRLGDFNKGEIRKLFDLLHFTPSRILVTGIWAKWEDITPAQAQGFLQSWKTSRFSLLTGAHNALSDILAFSWYSNPKNTAHLGYSGPPQFVVNSLPQFKTPITEGDT